jgi:dTDP-4-dehydrorhamnose 3,5-epimerase
MMVDARRSITAQVMRMFQNGKIHDVVVKNLMKFVDERGWLSELYRSDEIAPESMPVMTYVSVTHPGVSRGPHEHVDQTDTFGFIGPSDFKVYLWDNRKSSPTYGTRQIVFCGENSPKAITIPPGVIHAYKNVGGKPGVVVNMPNRLFAGPGKKETVDEIRYEGIADSPYTLD